MTRLLSPGVCSHLRYGGRTLCGGIDAVKRSSSKANGLRRSSGLREHRLPAVPAGSRPSKRAGVTDGRLWQPASIAREFL